MPLIKEGKLKINCTQDKNCRQVKSNPREQNKSMEAVLINPSIHKMKKKTLFRCTIKQKSGMIIVAKIFVRYIKKILEFHDYQ